MATLVRMEDIREFELVRRVPRESITDKVLEGVRQLNERDQIEPFLSKLLSDPTETPHGPTEITDIMTTHVTLSDRAVHAAFVNKGKATRRVSSSNVGHQIYRLRSIDGLGLVVLAAVGDIQDDIKRETMQVAADLGADYMIVDAVDMARLFIAYQFLCPVDGVAYDSGKCPGCDRSADQPLELSLKVLEELRFELLEFKDVSTGVAKRYRADVVTDPHYSKDVLREVLKVINWQLRSSDYYRSSITEAHYGEKEADCVFLFVYVDLKDHQQTNWICRTLWVRESLPEQFKPLGFEGDEQLGGIRIDWNESYEERRTLFGTESKKIWAQRIESLHPTIDRLVEEARQLFWAVKSSGLGEADFRERMATLESEALGVSRVAGSGDLPPVECEEADQAFQGLVTMAHNVFVPFASWARKNRDWKFIDWHVQTYLGYVDDEKERFHHEWRKVR